MTLGFNLYLQGALEESLEAHRQVETLGRALADPRLLSLAAFGRGLVHAEREEWEAALEAGKCALESSFDPFTKARIATTRIAPCIRGLWPSDRRWYRQVMRASAMSFVFKRG
jgi:hypothetical protein